MAEVLAQFFVPGRARTKGSMRPMCARDAKHTVHLEEEVVESKTWRRRVARACRDHQIERYGRLLKYDGPVEVFLAFVFEREMSVIGGERTSLPIPSHDTERPTAITIGDGDKLTRNVWDAISAPSAKTKRAHLPYLSGLILDDSQVSDWSGRKFWADETHPAGVHVVVMPAAPPESSLAALDQLLRATAPNPSGVDGA